MIEIEAEKSAIRVKLDLAVLLPRVRADKVMIQQVILNLVSNAIESMRDTAAERRVLSLRSAAGLPNGIEIEVVDNGAGLPAQLEENLFIPFYTTKPDGMGMGLHICRSIIEIHGGRLWARRPAVGGSAFHFTLPSMQP